MAKKTLAVVTSTRADYGLLRPVLQKLFHSETVQPLLLVTGTHLEKAYGETVHEIENDGFAIAARLPILGGSTAEVMAKTLGAFAAWFCENTPNGVLLLGDRFEIFAVAAAAAAQKVPIIHISGGDVTMGADDDFYRHCISKMAALHFPSNADSAARLLRLGEQPASVHNVGGLGDENIRHLALPTKEALGADIGFSLEKPYILVTYHPETATGQNPAAQCTCLLQALEKTGLPVLFTKANADAGGMVINAMLDAYAAQHKENCLVVASLGVVRYLAAMKYAAAVVGNSSSGVVETPTFGVPTVNIGQRQAGRIICANVLCCPMEPAALEKALQTVLSPQFAAVAHKAVSPYYGTDTSGDIVRITEEFLQAPAAPKRFYDGGKEVSCKQ